MWWRQIITGPDNCTVSIGRILGLIVFTLFVIGMPSVAIITVWRGIISASDWSSLFDKLQVYVPALILSVGGLIGLTSGSDPKP